MTDRLYVFVRNDLSRSRQAVQCGHAVAQFMLAYPDEWKNSFLIYLETDDVEHLHSSLGRTYKTAAFREPDYGDMLTAFAASCPEELTAGMKLL